MEGWIEVHDVESTTRKRPDGKLVPVRATSIDALRPYERGGCTLTIHGAYLHVTEDIDVVKRLIEEAS